MRKIRVLLVGLIICSLLLNFPVALADGTLDHEEYTASANKMMGCSDEWTSDLTGDIRANAGKFTSPSVSFYATEIVVYINFDTTSTTKQKAAFYEYVSDTDAGAFLFETTEVTTTARTSIEWVVMPFTTPQLVEADTTFFLAVISDISENTEIRHKTNSGKSLTDYGNFWDDPFIEDLTHNHELCIYVNGQSVKNTEVNTYIGSENDYEVRRDFTYQFPVGSADKSFNVSIPNTEKFLNLSAGGALNFDGSNDYVDFGDKAAWDLASTGASFEVWFKAPTKPDDNYARIFDRCNTSHGFYFMMFKDTGGLYFAWKGTGDGLSISTPVYSDGIWRLLTLAVNITSKRGDVYINGDYVTADLILTGDLLDAVDNTLYVGGVATGNSWKGVFDEVRIYNRTLSSSEIAEHYEGIYTDETGLILHVGFDDYSADDLSGEGNHGTEGGSPEYESGKFRKAITSGYSTTDYNSTHQRFVVENSAVGSNNYFMTLITETYDYQYTLYGLKSENGTDIGAVTVTISLPSFYDDYELNGIRILGFDEQPIVLSWDLSGGGRRYYYVKEAIETIYVHEPDDDYATYTLTFSFYPEGRPGWVEASKLYNGIERIIERREVTITQTNVPAIMVTDTVYYLQYVGENGDIYDLGVFVPGVSYQTFRLSKFDFDDAVQPVYDWVNVHKSRSSDNTEITVDYSDILDKTTFLELKIYFKNNTLAYYVNETSPGTYVQFQWNTAHNSTEYLGVLYITHTQFPGIKHRMAFTLTNPLNRPFDLSFLGEGPEGFNVSDIFCIVAIVAIAGVFSSWSIVAGGFMMVLASMLFIYQGWVDWGYAMPTLAFLVVILMGLNQGRKSG